MNCKETTNAKRLKFNHIWLALRVKSMNKFYRVLALTRGGTKNSK